MKDTLIIGGHEFHSRFILGSGKYSLEKMPGVIENSGAEIITLALEGRYYRLVKNQLEL